MMPNKNMHGKFWALNIMVLVLAGISQACTMASETKTVTVPATTVYVTVPASPPASTSPVTVRQPAVIITYSAMFSLEAGIGSVLTADAVIENRGYDSFSAQPANFSVIVSNIPYPCNVTASDLAVSNLPDGGRAAGRLVFAVPAGAASSRVGYHLVYSGPRFYNIEWVKRGG